jgi:hypothetical protein
MSDVVRRGPRLPNRYLLRQAGRYVDVAAVTVAGLLAFDVIPPVPGIRAPEGRPADYQGLLLVASVMAVRRGYRIARWIRQRRRTRRMRRRSDA